MCLHLSARIRGVLCLFLAGVLASSAHAQSESDHRFDVRDSISMTTFSIPTGLRNDLPVETSPNGRFFWFVTTRGIIESNEIESTLWVIPSSAVRRSLDGKQMPQIHPWAVARLKAVPTHLAHSSYESLISDIRWSQNSRNVYFLGQKEGGGIRLFRVDLATDRFHAIGPPNMDVQQYDFRNSHLALTATPAVLIRKTVPWSPEQAINAVAGDVTGMGVEDILAFPPETHQFGTIDTVPELWAGSPDEMHRVPSAIPQEPDVQHAQDVASIAPNGRMVIRLLPVHYIRPEWSAYNPMPGYESWRIRPEDQTQISSQYWFRLREYILVDSPTGKTSTLIDAPSGDSLAMLDRSLAVWSPDSKNVLLGNVALPFEGVDAAERERRKTTCAVADVEIATHKVECIVNSRDAANVIPPPDNPHPLRLRDASWDGDGNAVTLRFSWHDKWGEVERYRRLQGKWSLESVAAADPVTGVTASEVAAQRRKRGDVELVVRQGLNTPPALWSSDTRDGTSRRLWDPNPQLHTMQLGKASLYHWTDKTGYESTGILVLPPDYEPGKRYPLVIQTHGVWEQLFITDGSYTTAMAARPLASSGIVVLQTGWNATHFAKRQEVFDQVAMFDAAIRQLDKEGMIDPHKVGIIGFSRTVGHVEQALIDDPFRYAAATLADGLDVGYMQYMLFADGRPSLAREYEKIVGTVPVGTGIEKWIGYSPSFQMDKVRAPLRIEAIDPSSVLTMWESYAVLRRLHRPVDLIYLPGGQHILQRPLDRLASQQGNVDWFRFWLQGNVDPDPSKSSQYARWKSLKAMQ
jgi:dipeptidyl aminopeptidase/acylaminoacyl peptidase